MTTKNDLDDLDLMTNLYPRTTGLPMVVWVGPSYGAGHSARVKVMQRHGQQMDPSDLAVVALQPQPHVVAGRLSAADLQLIAQSICASSSSDSICASLRSTYGLNRSNGRLIEPSRAS
jgi:hypothetical protein